MTSKVLVLSLGLIDSVTWVPAMSLLPRTIKAITIWFRPPVPMVEVGHPTPVVRHPTTTLRLLGNRGIALAILQIIPPAALVGVAVLEVPVLVPSLVLNPVNLVVPVLLVPPVLVVVPVLLVAGPVIVILVPRVRLVPRRILVILGTRLLTL